MKRKFTVGIEDTAKYQGSGDLEVLSTPRLVAYMENVAKEMIDQNSVGYLMEVKHLAPTARTADFTIDCKLIKNEGRKYEFVIEAFDEVEQIGKARHIRFVVDGDKLLAKANEKLG